MKVFICVFFYIFTGFFCASSSALQKDSILAYVNDKIILNSDVKNLLFFLKKSGQNIKIPLKKDFLKEQIIHKLIIDSLILQEADRMNIVITEEQVNNFLKNMALDKNITVDDLKNYITLNNVDDHFAYQNYINNVKKLLKIQMMQSYELHKRVNISEREVNVFFKKIIKKNNKLKKINLSYILLPFDKNEKKFNSVFKSKESMALKIVDKIKNGYNFEKFYMKCKKNNSFLIKNNFWIRLFNIQKILHKKNFDILEKGKVLGPFLEKKGFYILKVNDICDNKENIINQFYIQHCLLKTSMISTDSELKNNIFNIYENIEKGVYSFDDAVKKLSNDFYSSYKKGDIGWISTEFFNKNDNIFLSKLKKYQISKPIKSNLGWHILKILDKRQINTFYNFQKKQIYNILLEKKMALEKREWIKELKNLSYIKIIRT